jgi:hypothetical protein
MMCGRVPSEVGDEQICSKSAYRAVVLRAWEARECGQIPDLPISTLVCVCVCVCVFEPSPSRREFSFRPTRRLDPPSGCAMLAHTTAVPPHEFANLPVVCAQNLVIRLVTGRRTRASRSKTGGVTRGKEERATWMCDVDARGGCVPLHEFANRAMDKRLRTKSQIVSFAQYTERDASHPSINQRRASDTFLLSSGEVGDV